MQRCRTDTTLLRRAHGVFLRWCALGVLPASVQREWQILFERPLEQIVDRLTADDDDAARLRSSSPFAVLLSPKERWALWRNVTAV